MADPYRSAPDEQPSPEPYKPIEFTALTDDVVFWSAVAVACCQTEGIDRPEKAIKWADYILDERRKRFGNITVKK